ncbi:MAG: hypothetical protein ACKVQK_12200 [Burkholderiales bacterium]
MGLDGGNEIARTEQVVIAEVDGELLRVGYLRGNLHGEVRLVLTGEHAVGHLVKYLRQLRGMILAHRKNNRLTDFATNRIAKRVLDERLAEQLIGVRREETLFELALTEGLLLIIASVIRECDDKAFFGQ